MNFIPQMEPWFGDEERDALFDYMGRGGWLTEFKLTEQFELMIAAYTGAKHCILVNNGTVSITLAAMACGISHGDEVIVPNYTMIATPNSIRMLGGIPTFVDVEAETLCMNIENARKSITPKTRAILLVSANGRYPGAGIAAFEALCREEGLALIEDAAQSLGSFYPDGRHMGTAGLVGSYSFSVPKIISTGQGGAIVTDSDETADKVRKLKDFGRSHGGNDIHDTIGFNFKFTDLQACIGIEQMKKLKWRVGRKKEIYRLYKEILSTVREVRLFQQDLVNTTPWFIDALVEDRENLQLYLKENGIGTRLMYPPINRQKCYQVKGEHAVSNLVGRKGLWLPSASQLTNEQIEFICGKVVGYYGG